MLPSLMLIIEQFWILLIHVIEDVWILLIHVIGDVDCDSEELDAGAIPMMIAMILHFRSCIILLYVDMC